MFSAIGFFAPQLEYQVYRQILRISIVFPVLTNLGIYPKIESKTKLRQSTMIRKAFRMQVYPEYQDEYQRRHSPIWKQLHQTLKDHGVHNYSIFLDKETSQLFGYVEIEDPKRWDAIAQTGICQKWWAYMKDIMPSNPDNSPQSRELTEVFHID